MLEGSSDPGKSGETEQHLRWSRAPAPWVSVNTGQWKDWEILENLLSDGGGGARMGITVSEVCSTRCCWLLHETLASWSNNVGNSGLNLVRMIISLQKMLESWICSLTLWLLVVYLSKREHSKTYVTIETTFCKAFHEWVFQSKHLGNRGMARGCPLTC